MKTKKPSGRQKNTPPTKRRLHKRLALHPLTILLLLCFGVLMVGATFRATASPDTIVVTAKVPAPLPGSPAIITSPHDQQHVTAQLVTVSGTCPNSTYVKVYTNNIFSGVSQCDGGMFFVDVTLSPGANQMQARVFNLTDDEGPASAPITVYYDQPTNPLPQPGAPSTGQNNISSTVPPVSGGQGTAVQPLRISLDYHYVSRYQGELWSWQATVTGGIAPYTVMIAWGDGQSTTLKRADSSPFTISHAFTSAGSYQPLIHVTDQQGTTTTLQLAAQVMARPQSLLFMQPVDSLSRYLWIAWPVYGALLLMVISFWLGELEVTRQLRSRRPRHRRA